MHIDYPSNVYAATYMFEFQLTGQENIEITFILGFDTAWDS